MIPIDIEKIVDYFIDSDVEYLKGMGAEKSKLPSRKEWIDKLKQDYEKGNDEKTFYYIIWLIESEAVGHSNINNIDFGKSATMHLHLWEGVNRKNGLGEKLLKKTIPYYFNKFRLEKLICEPYSENPAPNKILKKIGFKFERSYEKTPGWINFRQIVNRYELLREDSIMLF